MRKLQIIGLILGPVLFFAILVLKKSPPAGLTPAMLSVSATATLMAVWWITETIPIAVTSLLPVVLFPLLSVMPSKDATLPYANHLIYLFIGGFLIAIAIEKWELHKRIALRTIKLIGTSSARIILGFMVASGLLSMWVSNTATTLMMLPVAMAVVSQVTRAMETEGVKVDAANFNFGTSLMLGIAYAASIGGVGTIIGSPPNALTVGIIEQQFGQQISFAKWMLFTVPLSAIFLIICWFLLVKILYRPETEQIQGGREIIEKELKALGPMKKEEKLVILVFAIVALCWITRGFIQTVMVGDATIAITGAIALFLIPSDFKQGKFLLDWQSAVKLPWGVVILFGGGLALADGISKVGLAEWLAGHISALSGISALGMLFIAVVIPLYLTEVTSNTATATLLVPIMGSVAISMGFHPFGAMIACCIATSYAFMLPVATPPNAVVFGSGYITIYQMAKAGFWLNILGTLIIVFFSFYLLPLIWGFDLASVPEWVK